MLDEWLEATARASEPAVRFSSCFPYQGDTLLVVPPRNLWPPPPSSKVRWKGARFVPLSVVESLAAGKALSEDGWIIDGPSECLLPFSTPPVPGPFRVSVRSSAAVDREGESVSPHSTACPRIHAGQRIVVRGATFPMTALRRNNGPLRSRPPSGCSADSGFGGKRSQGWGRAEMPEITEGSVEVHFQRGGRSASLLAALAVPPGCLGYRGVVPGQLHADHSRRARRKRRALGRSQETDAHGGGRLGAGGFGRAARIGRRCGSRRISASRVSLRLRAGDSDSARKQEAAS